MPTLKWSRGGKKGSVKFTILRPQTKSYAFTLMSYMDFVHSPTFLKLTEKVKTKGMQTICFGDRIGHCPQNVGFIHYLCFITATTFKIPDYGQVSEATNLECDVPSSESYKEVLRLVAWMMVLKVSLIFFCLLLHSPQASVN